ncbi:arabinan endo-1,5-alpha-L-arabinosidase [Gracilibacillus dipsosauri]|uniref:Endo-alpha-(1->5)-L-arabinanase n=2 Tax=Gracilibacillus dipsosauri TaxID=178340 RepID=A0A317KWA4_9BACI|nr:arabinan endo-1,5-alpha-L-arabinosidase [Gracilibacillus dipsosauri]
MVPKQNLKVIWKTLFLSLFMTITFIPVVSADFWDISGDTMLHDPSITQEGSTWWAFGTGEVDKNGVRVLRSFDGSNWHATPVIFPQPLSWWSTYVPLHASNQWAPDIQYYNGRYWLYYSVSSFGSNNSLIGLTSTDSIVSGNWRDDGLVIRSTTADNFNAIDGDLVIDENGQPWLSFGSFWSGIKLTKLDPNTMKPTGQIYSIAARPNVSDHAIEAPNITYKDGYYYLFVSFDHCCRGVDSDYKIAYGRSKNITGPYYDKNGVNMLNGGGTILDAGNERWIGPGHQDVYNNNVIVRHAYDANNNGAPRLLINDLYWDSNGWPTY